ncbi:MAG TPA: VWA domain-containing protein [Vineibacter sp.]|nr:VWA domain-containing protein [Vineibacter sp.]
MTGADRKPSMPVKRGTAGVDAFLDQARALPAVTAGAECGRLLFCMDATASRQPAWDRAAKIQGEMFVAAEQLGGLDVRLAFYRGFDDFKASKWTSDGLELARLMARVECLAGNTQIGRVFGFAAEETRRRKLNALVFVGDCFEEDFDQVGALAGQLGLLGVPAFLFQEGGNLAATRAFAQFAKLTHGRHCRFDLTSPDELRRLLGAVAAYAAGGAHAMADYVQLHRVEALRLTGAAR